MEIFVLIGEVRLKLGPIFEENTWKLYMLCDFQKGQLMQVPSLDYSNEEELNDDTKLLYENFDKKMDLCKYICS